MDQFESTTSNEKIVCTEGYPTAWYAPTPLTYNTPFMTPFPSFNQYDMTGYSTGTAQWPTPPTYNDLAILPPSHANSLIERPRSSPSTFGPSANEVLWPENPLGIRFPMAEPQMIPSNAIPTTSYQTPAAEFTTPSPPQRRSSADTQRYYPSIAPNPAGLVSKRRQEQEDEEAMLRSNSKRRKRTPSLEHLNDEERLLITLKEDEALPWKEIAARFSNQLGQSITVATLQMRYLRLRQRFRNWEERDLEALRQAHEYWEKCKWDIISQKMLEFGVEEKWPSRHCARKWAELAPQHLHQHSARGQTPQQHTPSSQQHTPTPHYATMAEGFTGYGYALSL
ncbi:hypothetical protein D6C97_06026 [Aureobasidium pullulans]|nr:hypothetical protein D6D25_02110 [Aureobasidium pullulans]THY27533.1 hypothetical protein D6D00_04855 [Aureobasidium pullulans]THY53581.1 hypothetical protein D6C97_06026 [Aureobasidium pullulans]